MDNKAALQFLLEQNAKQLAHLSYRLQECVEALRELLRTEAWYSTGCADFLDGEGGKVLAQAAALLGEQYRLQQMLEMEGE